MLCQNIERFLIIRDMRVLAIDPGFGRCGVAVIEEDAKGTRLIHSDCIETDPSQSFGGRLLLVGSEIERLIAEHRPDTIAMEELFFSTNRKTALRVAEVRGMIIYLAERSEVPVREHNPLSVKVALTGYGKATKHDVMKMVDLIMKTTKKGMLDDEYDAIAVGLAALRRGNPPT